jgi:hypothetical protein
MDRVMDAYSKDFDVKLSVIQALIPIGLKLAGTPDVPAHFRGRNARRRARGQRKTPRRLWFGLSPVRLGVTYGVADGISVRFAHRLTAFSGKHLRKAVREPAVRLRRTCKSNVGQPSHLTKNPRLLSEGFLLNGVADGI